MAIKSYIENLRRRWAAWRHSQRTNSLFLYLTCLVISFLFWMFLTLGNETQSDLTLPLKLTSVPDSTTIISGLPQSVRVSVRDKGSALLRYNFGHEPTMNIDFIEAYDGSGNLKISSIEMLARVRRLFANTTAIEAISPDSLSIKYTSLPGKKVPVNVVMNVSPDFRYVMNGETILSHDSVTVYSDRNTLGVVTAVSTRPIFEAGLTDTMSRLVGIVPIPGAKIVPDEINVVVPVEQLINKKQNVAINVLNVPAGVNVVTFPSTIEASYLIPQSAYHDAQDIVVVLNYNDILSTSAAASKVPISVFDAPEECQSISLASDSVEYIVEKTLR